MQDRLKEQLSLHDSLLCNGEFFHIRCSAHVLNIIVQEGLKVVTSALYKIKEFVKYVKGSEGRKKKFEECIRGVGNIDTSIGLRLDVSTRWNSTYLMLESAIRYKKAFASLQLNDRDYKSCPSSEEWERREKICEFLEPFYDATNMISGSSYPTSNLYFLQVFRIERMLKAFLNSEDELISSMCVRMLKKFNKYWSQYSVVLAFGAVLDPRVKLSALEHLFSKVEDDISKCQEKVALIKEKMFKLFENYVVASKFGVGASSSSRPPQNSNATSLRSGVSNIARKGKRMFDDFKDFNSQNAKSAEINDLELYLDESLLDLSTHEDLDILDYWKVHMHRYPTLALMARDILAIPITTIASESSFSIGSRVLTKYRCSTLPEKVETLICTRNWLHGYNSDHVEKVASVDTLDYNDSNIVDVDEEENEEDDSEDDILDNY